MYWVYKCNSLNRPHQPAYGDWNELFSSSKPIDWGTIEWIPALENLHQNDMIIAYQTDRNEFVGIAEVVRFKRKDSYRQLILKPLERIGVKIRPLKQKDPKIEQIKAFQPGPVQTLYEISVADARYLIKEAKKQLRPDEGLAIIQAEVSQKGIGFGTPEQNRKVEEASMGFVSNHFKKQGWRVIDVSSQNLGYDLRCIRGKKHLHVEVKGTKGTNFRFIITSNEKRIWNKDQHYVLALVIKALSESRTLFLYEGPKALKRFSFRPVSYVATFKGV